MNSQYSSHTHWLAAQCHPQTKASQRVCLLSPENKLSKMPHYHYENWHITADWEEGGVHPEIK